MKTIAFIGLGRMGLPMASNLIKAGFAVIGCDLDAGRREALAGRGGQIAATPAQAAAQSDMSISMIMNDAILRAVAMGPDGVFAGARRGARLRRPLDGLARRIRRSRGGGRAADIGYVCAKVAGSIGLAESAGLSLFASGARADLRPVRAGVRGHGGQARLCRRGRGRGLSQARAQHDRGHVLGHAGRGAGLRERGGLALSTMVDILEAGPLGSRQLTLKAPILKERRFEAPPSDIDTAAKDVDMILDTARKDAMPLPIMASVRQMMANAQAHGGGKRDIYSILEAFEEAGGLKVKS